MACIPIIMACIPIIMACIPTWQVLLEGPSAETDAKDGGNVACVRHLLSGRVVARADGGPPLDGRRTTLLPSLRAEVGQIVDLRMVARCAPPHHFVSCRIHPRMHPSLWVRIHPYESVGATSTHRLFTSAEAIGS